MLFEIIVVVFFLQMVWIIQRGQSLAKRIIGNGIFCKCFGSSGWVSLLVAEVHALMQGFQPLHHLYSWLISALHTAGGVLISQGVGHPSPRLS